MLATQGYQASPQRLRNIGPRDCVTEYDQSEARSWHVTRLNSAKGHLFQDIKSLRQAICIGAYSAVYEAIDQVTGYAFAIKVVKLNGYGGNIDAARTILHQEIQEHILEYLGCQLFETRPPEIFMPIREGSLTLLAQDPRLYISHDKLCPIVMEQMLSALDYLANENLIHEDLKPNNILYFMSEGNYYFQLADFGLAKHRSLATTFGDTGFFQAPELWPGVSNIHASQSPKVDVWSLFATVIVVYGRFKDFPPATFDYATVLSTLTTQALRSPRMEPMARLYPDRRALAAQMLVHLFDGKGLTTSRSDIPPIKPDDQDTPRTS